jgi:hypothetical protein
MSDDAQNTNPDRTGWIKSTVTLPATHSWKSPPGYNVFVADRGAVRFDIPTGWVIRHDQKDTLTIHDVDPPADNARISLTVFRLPPIKGGWKQLPLEKLLYDVCTDAGRMNRKKKSKQSLVINTDHRPDMDLVWVETEWKDEKADPRMVRSRQLLARARGIQGLITFDFYKEMSDQFLGVWMQLTRSLRLGVPVNLLGQIGN